MESQISNRLARKRLRNKVKTKNRRIRKQDTKYINFKDFVPSKLSYTKPRNNKIDLLYNNRPLIFRLPQVNIPPIEEKPILYTCGIPASEATMNLMEKIKELDSKFSSSFKINNNFAFPNKFAFPIEPNHSIKPSNKFAFPKFAFPIESNYSIKPPGGPEIEIELSENNNKIKTKFMFDKNHNLITEVYVNYEKVIVNSMDDIQKILKPNDNIRCRLIQDGLQLYIKEIYITQ